MNRSVQSETAVLQALGAVGFVKRRIRLATPEPVDHRIRLPLAGDLDLGEHLRIFHNLTGVASSIALHSRLHQAVGFGHATLPVAHWHDAALSAQIREREEARANAEIEYRRVRAGLPPDAPV
jgi:hypothetical protein